MLDQAELWDSETPTLQGLIITLLRARTEANVLAIREGRWKWLLNPERSRVELYDIPADPSEMNNLAAANPKIVKRLSNRVLAWQKTLPPGPIDPDAGKAE